MNLSPYMLSQILAAIIMLAGMIVLMLKQLTLWFPTLNHCTRWLQDKNIRVLLRKLGILEKGADFTNEYHQSTQKWACGLWVHFFGNVAEVCVLHGYS